MGQVLSTWTSAVKVNEDLFDIPEGMQDPEGFMAFLKTCDLFDISRVSMEDK